MTTPAFPATAPATAQYTGGQWIAQGGAGGGLHGLERPGQPVRAQAGRGAGIVGIKPYGVSQPEAPFGGIKASGEGSEIRTEGLLACAGIRTVTGGRYG